MASFHFNERTLLLHPLVVFSGVWLTVVFLYSLHLSSLLLYSTSEVIAVTGYIWIPFLVVVTLCTGFHQFIRLAYRPGPRVRQIDFRLLERRLSIWFRVWLIVSVAEIFICGGVPIVWLIQHSAKTYFEFGIHTLHGLANSLLVSAAICRFALYLFTGQRRHLKIPILVVVWSVIIITRQLMITALLEYAIVFLSIKAIRTRMLARIAFAALILILSFGIVGDMRTGSETFRSLAQPTAQYPEWLPSGVLWVYIYVTTPLNNLIYAMHISRPIGSLLFPNTVSSLVPSALQSILFGDQAVPVEDENLVTQAFNVSTAYIGPYMDYGLFGVVLYSSLTAFACQFFWYRPTLRDLLIFAVLAQCLALSLFSNFFFILPVIFQVFWLFYFFAPEVHLGKRVGSVLAFK